MHSYLLKIQKYAYVGITIKNYRDIKKAVQENFPNGFF